MASCSEPSGVPADSDPSDPGTTEPAWTGPAYSFDLAIDGESTLVWSVTLAFVQVSGPGCTTSYTVEERPDDWAASVEDEALIMLLGTDGPAGIGSPGSVATFDIVQWGNPWRELTSESWEVVDVGVDTFTISLSEGDLCSWEDETAGCTPYSSATLTLLPS